MSDNDSDNLDRNKTSYNVALSTSTTSGYVNLSIHYAFKESSKTFVDNSSTQLKIKVPSAATLVPKSFKVDGKLYTANMDENGYISVPVKQKEGNITFALNVANLSYLLSYAQLEYKYNGVQKTETIGIVNMQNGILTLNVPDTTESSAVKVMGLTEPGQQVTLYMENKEETTVIASNTGLYSATLVLPNPQEGNMYKIEAKVINGEKKSSAIAYTEYTKNAIKVTECMMYYRGNTYDLLALEGKRPVISWASGSMFTFKVAFNNYSNVGEVYIVSTKNGEERRLEATWNEEKQAYIAAGFAGYVPGSISVEYGEGLGVKFKDTFAEIKTIYDELDTVGCESKVTMGDGTEFYYSMEQQENISSLPNENLEKIQDDGNIYYISQDIYYSSKGNKVYGYQDLYMQKENGQYTLLKTGIGLENSEIPKAKAYVAKASDSPEDILEEVMTLIDFLAKTSEDTEESEIYASLDKTLNATQKAFDFSDPEYQEIESLKARLKLANMIDNTRYAYDKINEVIENASHYSNDPNILPADDIAEKMGESVDEMKKVSKKISNRQLREIMKELCDKGWFEDSLMEKTIKKLSNDMKSSVSFNAKYAIDPSGYVYEAVTNNRIENVKATIYHKNPENGEIILWNADEYDQSNPIYTNKDGEYAWDVPEGEWQVKYEKEGYETTFSEWLPVPPPQLDINIALVSKENPIVETFMVYPDHAKIIFSKYMIPESIVGLRLLDKNENEMPYILEYDETQKNADGVNYAKEYVLRFDKMVLEKGSICKLVLDSEAKSYAGSTIDVLEQEGIVDTNIEIIASDSVTVKMGETLEIPIDIVSANQSLEISAVSGFEEIATVEIMDTGNIKVMGQMYGETEIFLTIPRIGINKTIKVIVGKNTEKIEIKQEIKLPQKVYIISVGESIEIVPSVYPDSFLKGKWIISDETIMSEKDNNFNAKKEGKVTARYTLLDDEKIYAECQIIVVAKVKKGDVNGDGAINVSDGVILKKYLAGMKGLNVNMTTSDVNADGEVNIRDAVILMKYLAGMNIKLE